VSAARPYPIALTGLAGAVCVVAGGGEVAARKVGALLESGARVRVVSPRLHGQLEAWRDNGRIEHVARPWREGDCAGAVLVFACTANRDVNARVAAEARTAGILHNVADDPAAGTFHTLGVVQRGEIQVAVGTGGASPALAALVRRTIDALLGPEYAILAQRMALLRRQLGPVLGPQARTRLWRGLATPAMLQLLRDGDEIGFEQRVDALVAEASTSLPGRPGASTSLPDRPEALGEAVAALPSEAFE